MPVPSHAPVPPAAVSAPPAPAAPAPAAPAAPALATPAAPVTPAATATPAVVNPAATPEPARPATTWSQAPGLALRGGLVGIAEGVPGISGGTVALVVGLFDRLIDAAGDLVHLARVALGTLLRRHPGAELRAAARRVDVRFLLPVLGGMAIMLLVALRIIAPLLERHPVHVNAVFFGMIAVSVLVPLRLMPHRPRALDLWLMLAGLIAGLVLTSLPRLDLESPPLWLVFVGAAIAINALVLPGVSGSFVLLILGLYVPVHHALESRDFAFILTFAAGAAIGLGSFVKVLQWLLHHRRQVTLAILAGLMAGSLRSLWPWVAEGTTTPIAPPGLAAALTALGLAAAGGAVVALALWWEARWTKRAGQ